MIKKSVLLMLLIMQGMVMMAQSQLPTDGVFKGRINNKEYNIFIQMNLYKDDVTIPGQDILGNVYGYLKKNTDSRVWAIMDVTISSDGKKATMDIINDYGSEDLTAELTLNSDGTYTLKQLEGSTIKIAGNKKWIKLPKELVFTK